MKKLILILGGISGILIFVIAVIYKNNYGDEEVVDIFKEEKEEQIVKEENKTEDNIPEEDTVIVDIKGMVLNPGVYEVDKTARVDDVIKFAGGLLEDADTSLINLAKIVEDEMTIIIYSNEEVKEKLKEELCVCDCEYIVNDACIEESMESSTSSEEENKLININTASKDELMTISGIGEAKAKAIIEYRESNGNFTSINDIKNVSGIGDALFEKIKAYITV